MKKYTSSPDTINYPMDADPEIANLVKVAQKGDLAAFNQLVVLFQRQAYNLAYRMLGDRDPAEDATQNAFTSAYCHLSSHTGGSFKAWLLRIVYNTCIDEIRRSKRHPQYSIEPVTDDGEVNESVYWLADDRPSPEEEVESIEMRQLIQRCLDDLPDDYRSMVVLVDLLGMNYTEVARIIDRPIGTVKSRLARARLKLRQSLQYSNTGLINTQRLVTTLSM
jgi:RNA polymerase sigma-70 factor, ECF subfamily